MSTSKLNLLLSELGAIADREERMEFLIELAEKFQEVPEDVARRPFAEGARVPACQSEVFAFYRVLDEKSLKFYFAVENPQGISAKAMAAILDETLSGVPCEEVIQVPSDMVFDIFGPDIGMGKGQGLRSMLFMIQAFAKQHLNKSLPAN